MLSNSSKYALKAVNYLVVESSPKRKLLSTQIAEATGVPKAFLSNILHLLSQKDYVSATKGPKGGFFLTEEQKKRSIMDIIVEVEGKDTIGQCILNLDHCDANNPCAIHHFIERAKTDLHHSLSAIRLSDLDMDSIG